MKTNDGSHTKRQPYNEHMAALSNSDNEGLVVIQKTKADSNGIRSNAGYLSVFETQNIIFIENGDSLDRRRQVAMFTS